MPTISSSFAEIERRRGGGGEQTKSIKYAEVETLLSDHLSTESHALPNPAPDRTHAPMPVTTSGCPNDAGPIIVRPTLGICARLRMCLPVLRVPALTPAVPE